MCRFVYKGREPIMRPGIPGRRTRRPSRPPAAPRMKLPAQSPSKLHQLLERQSLPATQCGRAFLNLLAPLLQGVVLECQPSGGGQILAVKNAAALRDFCRQRFPEAAEIYAEEYEEVFAKLPVNETSYLIVVTRGHRDDMRVLGWAVSTKARYIAMIGSKRKVINVVKELEKQGIASESFARVFAPMGLEIGAVSPEEIAVSVVAEMIAVRRNADSGWRALSKSVLAGERLRALLPQ